MTNHDVPDELIAQQFEESRKFFALSFDQKMKVEVPAFTASLCLKCASGVWYKHQAYA